MWTYICRREHVRFCPTVLTAVITDTWGAIRELRYSVYIAQEPPKPCGGPVVASHLGVPQTCDVGVQVKLNSLGCPRQGHSSDQKDRQHEVRECGREVHHLANAEEKQERSKLSALD